jgi:hypothetical protein
LHAEESLIEMSAMTRAKYVAVSFSIIIAMSVLVVLYQTRTIDSRIFGVVGLAVMATGAIVWFLLFRPEKARTDGSGPTTVTDSQGKKAKYITIMLIWVLACLWVNRDGPWFPKLVGVSVCVLFLIVKFGRKYIKTS